MGATTGQEPNWLRKFVYSYVGLIEHDRVDSEKSPGIAVSFNPCNCIMVKFILLDSLSQESQLAMRPDQTGDGIAYLSFSKQLSCGNCRRMILYTYGSFSWDVGSCGRIFVDVSGII